MLDRHSPLPVHDVTDPHVRSAPTLLLGEWPLGGLAQVAGWPSNFDAAVVPALVRLGFSGIGDFRTIQTAGKAQAMRITPHRLLLRHLDPAVLFDALAYLDPAEVPILDLSSARIVIRIEGSQAEQLMTRLSSVDFGPDAFPVFAFAQTGIHHVGVLVQRLDQNRFDILVPTTWALSIWEVVSECAAPFRPQIV